MEENYISKTSGIGARDKIGYAMGDVASLLVFGQVFAFLKGESQGPEPCA